LYPDLTDAELLTAQDNLTCYLKLVLRIFERTETHPQAGPLTADMGTLSSGTPEKQGPAA